MTHSRSLPTIRQLAALAGVSRTTVSLALRNHPSIPASTRDRIQQLAQREGYKIDPVVATLMTQLRTARINRSVEKIAYITTWPKRDEWKTNSPNDLHFYQGACDRANKLGYEMEELWAKEPGMTPQRLSRILYTRAIRGVVLAPLLRPRGHFSLNWQHFAAAAISYTIVKPDLHRTTHYHYNGMIMVLRKLRHHGYRRVGFATMSDQDDRVNNAWLAAYLTYDHGQPRENHIPPLLVEKLGANRFEKWLQKYRPEAVVSNMNEFLQILQKLYKVPDEIGFASIDLPFSESNCAGIDQLAKRVGAAAVDLVVNQLQNNEFGLPECPKIVQIDGVWRDGATIRKMGKKLG